MYINQPNSPYHGMQLDVMRDYFDDSVIVCINNQEVVFSKKFLSEVHPSKIRKPRKQSSKVEPKTETQNKENEAGPTKSVETLMAEFESLARLMDDDKFMQIVDIINKEYLFRIFSKNNPK